MNNLKREEQQSTNLHSWLVEDNKRRNLGDREIFETYINLDTSCLNQKEKEKIIDMLYKYKETFNLRHKIGTCPYIEVKIDAIDKLSFLLDHTM